MNSDKIKFFFNLFLETIIMELMLSNGHNNELTNRKIQFYSNFMYKNKYLILDGNPLDNYMDIFYLSRFYHNDFGTSNYSLLDENEKLIAENFGSRLKYNKIPMEYNVHDIINNIESHDIPLLVKFFNNNIELFEEFYENINLIV